LRIWIKLSLFTMILVTILPNVCAAASEDKLLTNNFRLTEDNEKPVPFDIYDYGGKILKRPVLKGSDQFELKWRFDQSDTSNLIRDNAGNLFFSDVNNILYSISSDGKINWTYPLQNMEWYPELIFGKDGLIYALTNGSPISENGKRGSVTVLSADGKLKWSSSISNLTEYTRYNVDTNGNIIAVTSDGIVSINAKGEINWINKEILKLKKVNYGDSNWIEDNITKILTDYAGNIYILTDEKELFALDSNGNRKWEKTLASFKFNLDHLYFTKKGQFFLVNVSGVKVFDSSDGSILTDNTIDQTSLDDAGVPNDQNNGFYFNYDTNGIVKIDKDGQVIWRYRTPDRQYGWAKSMVSDKQGNLYFADDGGNIYSLSPDGKERFMMARNSSNFTSSDLFVSKNGTLFGLTEKINLFAIGRIQKSVEVFIDGNEQFYSQEPVIVDGSTLVPMRDIFESLGATVEWNNQDRTVKGTKGNRQIQLKIESKDVTINGQVIYLDVEPRIINGKTMIPLRVVVEAFGADVKWDDQNKNVSITTNNAN
jgi:hypothetical protein